MAKMAINKDFCEDIVKAGRVVFGRYGLKKTSMEEIARVLNITKGALYYYFKSKEELFTEVVDYELKVLVERIQKAVNDEVSPENKLKAYVITRLTRINDLANINGINVMDSEDHAHVEFMQILRKKYEDRQISIIKDILEEGQKQKVFMIKNMDLTAYAIFIQMKSLDNPLNFAMDSNSLKDIVDDLLHILFNGIKGK